MGTKKPIAMFEVLPGRIFIRGAFSTRPDRIEQLRTRNVDTVVALWGEYDVDLAFVFRYHHMPISDSVVNTANLPRLSKLAQKVASEVRDSDKAILSHCRGGTNRSALFAGLLLCELTGESGEDAANRIWSARPRALQNPLFLDYLLTRPPGGLS